MNSDFGFSVCRVCLSPKYISGFLRDFVCLFEENGENAKMLELISGIGISGDKNQHEALVCDVCLNDLKRAFALRQQIRNAEIYYFHLKRHRIESIDEESINISLESKIEIEPEQFAEVHDSNVDVNVESSEIIHEILEEVAETLQTKKKTSVLREKQKPIKSSEKEPKKKFECSALRRKFNSTEKPPMHNKNQQKVNEFRSKLRKNIKINCVTTSKSSSSHQVNNNEKTKSKKAFKCPTCLKDFTRNQDLRRHINTVHQKIQMLACETVKSSNKPRPFKCSFKDCSKCFTTKAGLQYHESTHSGVRPFVCECGKSFMFKSSLKKHQNIYH